MTILGYIYVCVCDNHMQRMHVHMCMYSVICPLSNNHKSRNVELVGEASLCGGSTSTFVCDVVVWFNKLYS